MKELKIRLMIRRDRGRSAAAQALSRPDIGEVGQPLLVRPVGLKVPVQDIVSNHRPFAVVLRLSTALGPGAQRVDRKLKSRIHRKGKRGKPLTEQAKGSNRTKPSVRVRVEHVFGAQDNDMGGTLVRTSGMVRAKARIGMKNLACNEEGKELIRGINSPTNATPPPVASPEPLPGVIRGVEITP